jgi:fructose-6-phosphate aldolase 2
MVHVQMLSASQKTWSERPKSIVVILTLATISTQNTSYPGGYRAMRMLKDAGINVTATAIFTQQQALVAMRAGADFVAPYVSRLDNISSHGIEVVADIVQNTFEYNLQSKVLAASFKTVDQIYRVSMAGAHSATINPELLHQLIKHPMTDISVKQFEVDGADLYDIEF